MSWIEVVEMTTKDEGGRNRGRCKEMEAEGEPKVITGYVTYISIRTVFCFFFVIQLIKLNFSN